VLVPGVKRLLTERSNQYRIKRYLLRNYDKTTRPVINDSAPLSVDISISLYHILDTVSPLTYLFYGSLLRYYV